MKYLEGCCEAEGIERKHNPEQLQENDLEAPCEV